MLILSAYQTEQYVRGLFTIGVHGYLLKNATGSELTRTVRVVAEGETVLSAEVSARPAAAATPRSGIRASGVLSDRERQVLALVRRGASNKDIAGSLQISLHTVGAHVSNAMARLGAHSRTEAISMAVQRGIIASVE